MGNAKHHIGFIDDEEQIILDLLECEGLSINARKQLKVILMLGNKGTVIVAAEIHAVSNQTVTKWKDAFNKDRLESLSSYMGKKN